MIKEKIIEIEIVKYIIAKKKLWERTKYQKQLNKNNNTVKNRNMEISSLFFPTTVSTIY